MIVQLFIPKNNVIGWKTGMYHISFYVTLCYVLYVGTKGVSQVYHLSFDDNKVLKIINWIC